MRWAGCISAYNLRDLCLGVCEGITIGKGFKLVILIIL